jgi:hypothetical protein
VVSGIAAGPVPQRAIARGGVRSRRANDVSVHLCRRIEGFRHQLGTPARRGEPVGLAPQPEAATNDEDYRLLVKIFGQHPVVYYA